MQQLCLWDILTFNHWEIYQAKIFAACCATNKYERGTEIRSKAKIVTKFISEIKVIP